MELKDFLPRAEELMNQGVDFQKLDNVHQPAILQSLDSEHLEETKTSKLRAKTMDDTCRARGDNRPAVVSSVTDPTGSFEEVFLGWLA